jgi:acyl-CoA hydrolase
VAVCKWKKVSARSYRYAQVNPLMQKTFGHSFLYIIEFSARIEHQQILPEVAVPEATKIIERIGQYLVMLVEDGAILQLGIAKIPYAVIRYLQHHKNLGVHSEMISVRVVDLILNAFVNNRSKIFHPD